MLNSSSWLFNNQKFYNDVATQSVRLDDGSSAYLTFTPSSASSATDRRKVTHSVWVKRGVLGADQSIYSANRASGGDYYLFRFSSDNKLTLILDVDAGGYGYDTSAVFRDVGAWYHVCVIIDTTQATNTNRVKIYVNGVLQDKTTKYAGGHVPQNFSTYVMDGNEDEVGRFAFTDASYFDGYMAEFITTIGQNNTISEFGELKNGVWIPINYEGSYGGNGFRLQFNQTGTGTGSSSTIGADTSGNANHWTSSGIVASDCDMPDSPENNFATALGSLAEPQDYQNYYKGTYSEGNLKVTGSSSGWSNGSSNFGMTSGKWYAECRINAKAGTGYIRFGMRARPTRTYDEYFWNDDGSGQVDAATTPYSSRVGTYTAGDILMVALDLDNSAIYFGKNGTWENSATSSEIANGTTTNAFASGSVIPTDDGYSYFFYCQPHSTGSNITWNFGQDSSFAGLETAQGNSDSGDNITDFYYTPPTGFLGNTTVNLPEPTISPNANTQANDYFSPTLYTSDNIGAGGTQSVTGVGFQPDWVWIKNRSSGGTSHTLFDSVRTAGKMLQSDNTSAEASNSQYGYLSSFDSDGFTLTGGTTNANFINQGTDAYVAWNWKTNGGTIATNTDGIITSSVSANTDAGFSIVSYTGNGTSNSDITIGHSLGITPRMVIVKNRTDANRWQVYHEDLSADGTYTKKNILLNSTNAESGYSSQIKAVSSTTFTVRDVDANGNANVNKSGSNYIAYCFAEIEGYSKFGGYTGNDSTDGNFIYLGFRPSFIIIKYTSGTAGGTKNWFMFDDARDTFNPTDDTFNANAPDGETANSNKDLDFLSNGFKIRNAEGAINNGAEYIYMAFAKTPFKYANAR